MSDPAQPDIRVVATLSRLVGALLHAHWAPQQSMSEFMHELDDAVSLLEELHAAEEPGRMSEQHTPAAFPQPWGVEAKRNAKGRAWYCVSRFIKRDEIQYVLEGFDDEPWRTRRRYEAQQCADELNRKATRSAS